MLKCNKLHVSKNNTRAASYLVLIIFALSQLVHRFMYIYTYIYIYTHTHIHTHTHTHRYAPYNDVSVNDGPHIRRWSHKIITLKYNNVIFNISLCNIIILTVVLQLRAVFSTVTCCTGF